MIFPPVMTRIGGWCCTAAALGWRKGTPSSAITQLTVSEGSSTFLLTFYVTIIPFDTCVFFWYPPTPIIFQMITVTDQQARGGLESAD
jgi:hypothetical protein